MNRAGPVAQLLWDLATDPEIRSRFLRDPECEIHLRGLRVDILDAIDLRGTKDPKDLERRRQLLSEALRHEERALNEIWGARPEEETVARITHWPPG